tara:strand:+ start:5657 stop:6430 length:774 start_codon:yes stop_codon:yes gene_type:complete
LSNRVEPEIPNITLDRDQVKTTRDPSTQIQKKVATQAGDNQAKPSPLLRSLLFLMPYVALAGTGWYFYQHQQSTSQALTQSIERIQQLENQLSATGEEIGESTVALKVKLEAISEKTELLLTEMDKLWASAWRRNQTEIKALNAQSQKLVQQQTKNTASVNQQSNDINVLADKVTATEFSINAVTEQMIAANTLKDEIKKLSTALNTLDADAKSRDKQQMFTATSINEFDTSLRLLIERIERIEAKISQQQTSPSSP